jgi:hypothetical protein
MKITVPKFFTGLGVIFVLITAIFTFWFWEAGNFSGRAVSGTYVIQLHGEKETLILRADHSFQQELDSGGTGKRAEGGWSVSGEGHIEFSPGFLSLAGEEVSPSGAAYGVIVNRFGFVSIALNPDGDGPRFHKKLFR